MKQPESPRPSDSISGRRLGRIFWLFACPPKREPLVSLAPSRLRSTAPASPPRDVEFRPGAVIYMKAMAIIVIPCMLLSLFMIAQMVLLVAWQIKGEEATAVVT